MKLKQLSLPYLEETIKQKMNECIINTMRESSIKYSSLLVLKHSFFGFCFSLTGIPHLVVLDENLKMTTDVGRAMVERDTEAKVTIAQLP